MNNTKIGLVVPTCRPEHFLRFQDAWDRFAPWDSVYVVETGKEPELIDSDNPKVLYYNDHDLDESPCPQIWSRKNSGARSYGFWKAWEDECDLIFTLDDDCYPDYNSGYGPEEFVIEHVRNLMHFPRFCTTVKDLHVRGFVYKNHGTLDNVCLSHGLWVNNADIDACQTLVLGTRELPFAFNRRTAQVLPSSQIFPICSMNLAFPRWAAPLMFHAPMGRFLGYERFDDIWMGFVIQRIAGHLGVPIVSGSPTVFHKRATDPFKNLEMESMGIVRNENLWQQIVGLPLKERHVIGCVSEIAKLMLGSRDRYLEHWGDRLQQWIKLFQKDNNDAESDSRDYPVHPTVFHSRTA